MLYWRTCSWMVLLLLAPMKMRFEQSSPFFQPLPLKTFLSAGFRTDSNHKLAHLKCFQSLPMTNDDLNLPQKIVLELQRIKKIKQTDTRP